MLIRASRTEFRELESMRERYRQEMNCQIIHDSIHSRLGWTHEYSLAVDGLVAGYGSLAVSGPWKQKPTLYEYYVLPTFRPRVFDLFQELIQASGAVMIETQSNAVFLSIMLHAFAKEVVSEAIVFQDMLTTTHAPPGVTFRKAVPSDQSEMLEGGLDLEAKWVVCVGDRVAGAGDVLYHYNPPYGDIYMNVVKEHRRRGIGAYLVQELKNVCYAAGGVPAARCNVTNVASRKTLQKAGFIPCAHLLNGKL